MHDGEGNQTDVPVVGVGGTVRIAVGQPDARSEIWRIWANPSTSDVYIGGRSILGVQKVSLHQSGKWRFAYTQEFAEAAFGDSESDRVIDRWQRPEPDEFGWTHGFSIYVRHEDVAPMDDTRLKKRNAITWLPAPPPGQRAGIHVYLVKPDVGEPRSMAGARLVDVLQLADGGGVFVLVTEDSFDPSHIDRELARAYAAVPEDARVAAQGRPGLRAGAFGHDDEGRRVIWDTAWSPPS